VSSYRNDLGRRVAFLLWLNSRPRKYFYASKLIQFEVQVETRKLSHQQHSAADLIFVNDLERQLVQHQQQKRCQKRLEALRELAKVAHVSP
jgi:hypothetical protein